MKTLILISIVFLSACFVLNSYAEKTETGSGLVISVDTQETPLKDVLESISKKTKWTILLDASLADKTVSGKYANMQIEAFLKRSLKGENLIVLIDEKVKTIEVRSFQKKNDRQVIANMDENYLFPSREEQNNFLFSQIEAQERYDAYMNNPNSIDPESGKTLGEIAALHAHEQKVYDEYTNNPNSIDPESGKTLGEIAALHAHEQKIYDVYANNPNSAVPEPEQ